jgi:2-polyprenyl-3-methyl-5-hydroxy-6-metoxy-1,4-benzoquinol methylase
MADVGVTDERWIVKSPKEPGLGQFARFMLGVWRLFRVRSRSLFSGLHHSSVTPADVVRNVKFVRPRNVRQVDDCFFYHSLDLPEIGGVDGWWDLRGRFDDYIGGVDLQDKTVLDVGAGNGFLTFEAEKRGAREVVSFDIGDARFQHLLPFKDTLYYTDHAKWRSHMNTWYDRWKNGYWLAHRLNQSKARAFYGDVYELPAELGLFDVTIIGSVLEHLRDQISAMASVARRTKSTMIIVTGMLENEDKTALFVGSADQPDQNYTWWAYSLGIYRDVLKMLGFRITSMTSNMYKYQFAGSDACRYTIVAARV